jgi:hypothetical protein
MVARCFVHGVSDILDGRCRIGEVVIVVLRYKCPLASLFEKGIL